MRLSPPLRRPPGIAAAVVWLPPGRDEASTAIAAGRLDGETARRLGHRELTESADQAAPELAVLAARKALAEAGWAPEELGLVVHAWIYHQGHDFWSPAHYVAQGLGAHKAVPVGVQQMCNGGAAAIELAATRMAMDPAAARCAVTTADVFAAPGFDRWRGDYGVAYGDSATALLLDRDGTGPYQLLAVATTSAPELEAMHRGEDPFSPAPRWYSSTVDVRRTKRAFLSAAGGGERFAVTAGEAVMRVVRQALDDARLTPVDPRIRYLALPRLGAEVLAEAYRPRLDELGLRHAEVLDLGRDTGHLGAGDCVANLADLQARQRLTPGEVALLLSAGAGFTWSCLVVRAGQPLCPLESGPTGPSRAETFNGGGAQGCAGQPP